MSQKYWRALPDTSLMFVSLAILWGTSFVAIEVGLHHVPALAFAALRYDVAGVVVLAYAVAATDRWRPRTRTELASVLVPAVFVFGAYPALLYVGETYVSGALAAVVVSLSPVLTAGFGSALDLEEPLTTTGLVGVALGILGVGVVVNPAPGVLDGSVVGVGLVLAGTACFALGSVLARPFDAGLPKPTTQAWGMVGGAVGLHVASLARGESLADATWTTDAVVALAYLALASGAVAFLVYFELLERVGATEITLVAYLEPVVAALVGWAIFGNVVDTTTALGFAVIFLGFAVLKRHALTDVLAAARQRVRTHA
ncbi:DMT family transporter [Halorubellus sp. JP-L1]|uniref:DMT family transporter n=1 Tax=Halorubellus sp. JP-L1 TaxID=2715753 RepID=UPI001407C11B|nr:DMT family transporter [Halorubellus sp. JP-L1]